MTGRTRCSQLRREKITQRPRNTHFKKEDFPENLKRPDFAPNQMKIKHGFQRLPSDVFLLLIDKNNRKSEKYSESKNRIQFMLSLHFEIRSN